jgi:hypothetical protein
MSGSELFEFQIETVDGAEYTVQAPEISIVATTLIASATLGKTWGQGRMITVGLAGAESLPYDENWNVVRDRSWPLCLQVLESLMTVRAPHGAAAQPDSFTRLMLLKEEAVRRCRSLCFARLATASPN